MSYVISGDDALVGDHSESNQNETNSLNTSTTLSASSLNIPSASKKHRRDISNSKLNKTIRKVSGIDPKTFIARYFFFF